MLLWLALVAPGGMVAGALVAHSLFWVLILFVALGPVAAAWIGRKAGNGWWVLVSAYSLSFGLGVLLFPDGETVPANAWGLAASAAGITAAVGLAVGWFSQPD
ncbi:MAG TPA: hypothetical protein PLX89_00060 [Verrucomicrobiota bacterium]|nr:hypothetical protein [Verrucomicrobiota bacterium]